MLKEKRCALIIVIILLIFASPCKAEPDSTIRYLMNEPVSLLDIGIDRFNLYLGYSLGTGEGQPDSFRRSPVSVSYRWEANKLRLNRILFFNKKIDVDTLKNECKEEIELIRCMVNYGLLESCFTHLGLATKNEPDNLVRNLEKIIEIRIKVINSDTKKGIECIAPLLGKDIYFMEKKFD